MAQCNQALARINQDLKRVLVPKAEPKPSDLLEPKAGLNAGTAAAVDNVELADVGQWYIEQQTMQAKIDALQKEMAKGLKPGPSFTCPLNQWTLVAGCMWVFAML
jgi:protein subunit release factor A